MFGTDLTDLLGLESADAQRADGLSADGLSADGLAANDLLGRLAGMIDELAATDVGRLSDAESVLALVRAQGRLEAVTTRALGRFDTERAWAGTGARAASAWLATETRMPLYESRKRFSLARGMADLPVAASAWLAGDISAAHLSRLAEARKPGREADMDEAEGFLVDLAREMGFGQFNQAVSHWEAAVDPDGEEEAALARQARRNVWMAQSYKGSWLGGINLDPLSGEIVATELFRRAHELYLEDYAAARTRLGRKPELSELARTPAQRRADALVEMATRSATPGKGTRPAPLFTVLVDYGTLAGRVLDLANGSVVFPADVVPWLSQADIERAVFSSPDRVEVSAKARLFTGATLRGLQIRDRHGCAHPYCFEPASHCEADHVIPYSAGGPTTQANGRMVCPAHNRARNVKDDLPPPRGAPPPRWAPPPAEEHYPHDDGWWYDHDDPPEEDDAPVARRTGTD